MATKRGVSVSVSRDVHRVLTEAALTAGPRVGRRVSLNTLIVAAIRVAERHPAELDALLVEDAPAQVEGGAA